MIIVKNEARPRGRPRAFDRDRALAVAARAFWDRGYEGVSIADLTAAIGITPQSLYAAFKSKADLYRESIAWYQAGIGAPTARLLAEEPSAVVAFTRVLEEIARRFTRPDQPHGCMVSTAVLTCAAENEPVAEHVSSLRTRAIAAFRARIEKAVAEGELRGDTDAAALARFLGAVIQGLSVQALDGADEAELLPVARIAAAEVARHRA
ncbi:TetR/AcrR family transcriptional regulator [Labrys wisconsinensis]|uniref:AcrR family transcriptional regulator n=1 Tax=Labrys wisconsinensis TaxID=425677 RepID=A0ABU0JIT8_9HYPH|nr:AcrR family transcriptional regulator [Labrys wisconsinensis]